jgi:Tfp pilus assembly protein PilX
MYYPYTKPMTLSPHTRFFIKSTARHSPGFALIATISVMVLLVLIALAMLSMSTIELRSNKQDKAMAENGVRKEWHLVKINFDGKS